MKSKCTYHSPPPWFRLYNELADDPKIRRVSVMTGQHELIIIGLWVKLLIIANKSPDRGDLRMAIDLPYSLDDISYDVRMDENELVGLLEAFITVDMIHIDNGCYVITHFDDRQFKSDSDGAERVRRHRLKKAKEKDDTPAGGDNNSGYAKHYSNVTVTPPESESDTDINNNNDYAKICTFFEANISVLSPIIAQKLGIALKECKKEWIIEAIDIAAENNVRKWSYIQGVLDRSVAAGQSPKLLGPPQNGNSKKGQYNNGHNQQRSHKTSHRAGPARPGPVVTDADIKREIARLEREQSHGQGRDPAT